MAKNQPWITFFSYNQGVSLKCREKSGFFINYKGREEGQEQRCWRICYRRRKIMKQTHWDPGCSLRWPERETVLVTQSVYLPWVSQRTDAFELWCWRRLLRVPWTARRFNQSILKGNQSWIFIGRTAVEAETPVLWPSDAKSWLIWKDPDAGKDWRQEKGTTEDNMVGWHHQLNGHEFG